MSVVLSKYKVPINDVVILGCNHEDIKLENIFEKLFNMLPEDWIIGLEFDKEADFVEKKNFYKKKINTIMGSFEGSTFEISYGISLDKFKSLITISENESANALKALKTIEKKDINILKNAIKSIRVFRNHLASLSASIHYRFGIDNEGLQQKVLEFSGQGNLAKFLEVEKQRDKYMVENILDLKKNVLVIVGLAHAINIEKMLKEKNKNITVIGLLPSYRGLLFKNDVGSQSELDLKKEAFEQNIIIYDSINPDEFLSIFESIISKKQMGNNKKEQEIFTPLLKVSNLMGAAKISGIQPKPPLEKDLNQQLTKVTENLTEEFKKNQPPVATTNPPRQLFMPQEEMKSKTATSNIYTNIGKVVGNKLNEENKNTFSIFFVDGIKDIPEPTESNVIDVVKNTFLELFQNSVQVEESVQKSIIEDLTKLFVKPKAAVEAKPKGLFNL